MRNRPPRESRRQEPPPAETRSANVRALAKLNLGLKVLHRRPDGYHELRTVFQTISLGDRIRIAFTPARRLSVSVACEPPIADNLAGRAAETVLRATGMRGHVEVEFAKRIPLGAGLGGGSSDAAAVLLALPVLAGASLPLERLLEVGAALGSDVPFFLLGGAAVATGRGTELYPLPDIAGRHGLLVAPEIHVSTAEAYAALSRRLTNRLQPPRIGKFQAFVWRAGAPLSPALPEEVAGWEQWMENDFEAPVFRRHPRLRSLKQRLAGLGASPALMTGSGSAIFGLFESDSRVAAAAQALAGERCFLFSFVGRQRYRSLWWRWLSHHIAHKAWPPPSRYSR
jgi:4-diphosphocytidyl-2-C-methyl-D-erythritol kinase